MDRPSLPRVASTKETGTSLPATISRASTALPFVLPEVTDPRLPASLAKPRESSCRGLDPVALLRCVLRRKGRHDGVVVVNRAGLRRPTRRADRGEELALAPR